MAGFFAALSPGATSTAGTETEERLLKRLATAKTELTVGATLPWDIVVVNDDLERAYARLRSTTAAARAAAAALRAGKGTA